MSWDYLTLCCCPAEEEWPAGGNHTADERNRVLRNYLQMIKDKFPIPEDILHHVRFKIKTFDHDLGPYSEVCVMYDQDDRKAVQFAYFCENNMPGKWTDTEVMVFKTQEEWLAGIDQAMLKRVRSLFLATMNYVYADCEGTLENFKESELPDIAEDHLSLVEEGAYGGDKEAAKFYDKLTREEQEAIKDSVRET